MSVRLGVAICALATLVPANAALADDPAPPASEPVERAAAPAPAGEAAPAEDPAASEETAEPSAPAAKPAQEDVGAPHEYTESPVPTPTGEEEDPEPVESDDTGDPQPGSTQPQPSSTAAPAPAVTADTGSAGDLPRTGPASPALVLTGLLLLTLGFLVRRFAAAQPSA